MDWLGLGTFITVCASALALVIKKNKWSKVGAKK